MIGIQVYDVEVDVVTSRPLADAKTHTIFTTVAVPLELSNFAADTEAQLIACQMAACHPHLVMPIASRITRLEL